MNWELILYYMGFGLVLLYLVLGLDDFVWDLFTIIRRVRVKKTKLDLNLVANTTPKMIAVMIAAWQEDNVLEEVVENFLRTTVYPKSLYHLFLGVYPNDVETLAVAHSLAARHYNVHVVINAQPGPTSKAQNVNHIIKEIQRIEAENQWSFHAFTVHDAEDVVHPYELKVTNHLIERYPALQFPVFPIVYKPTFRNFFKTLTSGTYADEFAENHFLVVSSRNDAHAFVPSAGTGFSLSRQVIDSFEGADILDNGSLTEDYKLSLTLFKQGFPLHYVLERIPRVQDDQKVVWDYIATRSLFPNTFQTALRQKTRWIRGITMQSLSFKEIMSLKHLSFVARYSMYRDQKAKIGNLLAFVGYPVFFYFVASLFFDLPIVYPNDSLSWTLSIVVTLMMIERQVFRAIAIYNVYGPRSVFFASLFPPGIPIRTIWGNFINFCATVRAYRMHFGHSEGKHKRKRNKRVKSTGVAWDKTEHHFLSPGTLKRYQRRLGDALLEKEVLTPKQLKQHLQTMNQLGTKPLLGQYLWEQKLVSEEQLLHCFADTLHKVYLESDAASDFSLGTLEHPFAMRDLQQYRVVPILRNANHIIMACGIDTPPEAIATLREHHSIALDVCFANRSFIEDALRLLAIERTTNTAFYEVLLMFKRRELHFEHVILIHNAMRQSQQPPRYAMETIGLHAHPTTYSSDANLVQKRKSAYQEATT